MAANTMKKAVTDKKALEEGLGNKRAVQHQTHEMKKWLVVQVSRNQYQYLWATVLTLTWTCHQEAAHQHGQQTHQPFWTSDAFAFAAACLAVMMLEQQGRLVLVLMVSLLMTLLHLVWLRVQHVVAVTQTQGWLALL